MNQAERRTKEFIAYEYKEIHVESSKASFLIDGYESFGWEIDDNLSGNVQIAASASKMLIRLKRNRKIMNKMELTRLQRNFEACVNEIDMLERAKSSKATMWSLIIGILGTAFMAGAVFAVTAQPPQILLCILFAIPAFIGWILPYFVYRKLLAQQTERIIPLIEAKYDEIYELCEKGNKLIY